MTFGAVQRLADGLAQHEVGGEKPHRLPGCGTHRRLAEPAHQAVQDRLRRLVRGHDPGCDAERPGGGGDQQRARARRVVGEIGGRELVLDQQVRGRIVRHAQQGFRQHHEGEALLGRERVLVQEILHPAEPAGPRPDRRDVAPRAVINARLRLGGPRRFREQLCSERHVIGRVSRAERREVRPGHGPIVAQRARQRDEAAAERPSTLPLVGRVASEASGVGVGVWRHGLAVTPRPPPRPPSVADPPHKGEGKETTAAGSRAGRADRAPARRFPDRRAPIGSTRAESRRQ